MAMIRAYIFTYTTTIPYTTPTYEENLIEVPNARLFWMGINIYNNCGVRCQYAQLFTSGDNELDVDDGNGTGSIASCGYEILRVSIYCISLTQ